MLKVRFRSILALMLALVATFTISCSSATTAATKTAPKYTPAQIEQIQQYVPALEEFRDRMSELQTMIQQRRWVDVGTFIHGPLGELRLSMNRVAANLSPQDKEAAREVPA